MMPSAQVVETSVNDTSNSPSQDYTHSDDHNLPNYDVPFCLVIGIKYEIFRAPLRMFFKREKKDRLQHATSDKKAPLVK